MIRGRVRTAIQFERPFVDLGRHSEREQPLVPQRVAVQCIVPLDGLDAKSDSSDVSVDVQRPVGDPSCFVLVVTPRARLKRGKIRCNVTATARKSEGQLLPPKVLPVGGEIVSDIQAVPETILFGARSVGEVGVDTVTLSSLTGQRFQVVGTVVEGNGISVEPANAAGAESPVFQVKQVMGPQRNTGLVAFKVRTTDGQESEVKVATSGHGVAVQASK